AKGNLNLCDRTHSPISNGPNPAPQGGEDRLTAPAREDKDTALHLKPKHRKGAGHKKRTTTTH
ncbi:MAG: hypothetical protein AB8E74_06635, partial [Prochlorococcus sp.]